MWEENHKFLCLYIKYLPQTWICLFSPFFSYLFPSIFRFFNIWLFLFISRALSSELIYHAMYKQTNKQCSILWQIASACWELFCLEHGIQPDGTMCQESNLDNDSNAIFSSCYCHSTGLIKCVPRAVLVDFEPIPIDEIRTGCYRSLFDPYTLITGNEDAASIYARGYNCLGSELVCSTMDRVRKQAECCECLAGFTTFRSIGGGTGSGFGTLIEENIADEFGKSCRHEYNIFPSPK